MPPSDGICAVFNHLHGAVAAHQKERADRNKKLSVTFLPPGQACRCWLLHWTR